MLQQTDISVAIDEKSSKYVNPNGVLGKLVRDENGTIVALVFAAVRVLIAVER